MNRSLEALAILVICLVGILAAVRISTKDSSSDSATMARQPAPTSEQASPAGSSSSALEAAQPGEWLAAHDDLQYEAGCGLDRQTGEIYRPLPPLLTPREFAERVIRSEPLPLIVLPELERLEAARTGYDAAYDAAVYGEQVAQELDYRQIEADYAAAELAAAQETQNEGTYSRVARTSPLLATSTLVPWVREQLQAVGSISTRQVQNYGRAYAPVAQAIQARWAEHVSPRLRHFPRPTNSARKELLLRQRAELNRKQGISWDDYLDFATRELAHRVEPKVERVAREGDIDEFWSR